MYGQIFGVIAPLLLIAGIGFALEKGKAGLHGDTLSTLTMMVGTPALVFSALTSTSIPDASLIRMATGALFVLGTGAIISAVILRQMGLAWRTFLPSLTVPNSGNTGLPVVLLAFGPDGLAIGVAFYFVTAIVQYTIIPIITIGNFSARRILREPLIWSVCAVILLKVTGWSPPAVIADTTRILGGMMIPVMVILLGGALARLRIHDLRLSLLLATIRLGIGLTSGTLAVFVLGATGIEAGALFLLSAMPSAVITYVFAQRYNRSPEQVAGLIVASTLMTFALLPVLLWIGIHIATLN